MTDVSGRIQRLLDTPTGQRVARWGRAALTLGVLVFLLYELRGVSWLEVLQGLPRSPWFYLLLAALYFLLPTVQIVAYRVVWDFRLRSAIAAFIKKRILNKDVLGYSGEVYLFAWARDHVDQSDRQLAECVRDMNIVSAAASTFMAVLLLAFYAVQGQVSIRSLIGDSQALALLGAGVLTVVIIGVVLRLRRYLFTMAWSTAGVVLVLHMGRMLVRQVLEIGMWHLAMPDIPLATWFTYAAGSVIVSRIPFMPNQDVVMMGLAVGMSEALQASEAHIFALFGSIALVNRLINLAFFAALSFHRKGAGQGSTAQPETDP